MSAFVAFLKASVHRLARSVPAALCYLNALAYAKERVQGADLTQMTDKAAPRVTITHHPDVRRS